MITEGSPARRAAIAPATAIGETTLACAWTTSNPSSRTTRPSRRSAPGVKANPDPGASGARIRCTGMPSTTSVAARRRHDARIDLGRAQREREIAQMELDSPLAWEEPVADEGDAHDLAPLEQQVERQLRCGIRTTKALELVVPRPFGHEAQRDGGAGVALHDDEGAPSRSRCSSAVRAIFRTTKSVWAASA